jgi:hypothetical protein
MNWAAIWIMIFSRVKRKKQTFIKIKRRRKRVAGRGLRRDKFVGELAEWFESDFYPARLIGKSEKTVKAYQCTIRALCKVLGRPAVIDDLNDETVSKFATHQLPVVSLGTVLRHLDCLLSLANFARNSGRISLRLSRTAYAIQQLKLIAKCEVSHELV